MKEACRTAQELFQAKLPRLGRLKWAEKQHRWQPLKQRPCRIRGNGADARSNVSKGPHRKRKTPTAHGKSGLCSTVAF